MQQSPPGVRPTQQCPREGSARAERNASRSRWGRPTHAGGRVLPQRGYCRRPNSRSGERVGVRRGLRPDRPSRMQILPLSPLSGGNPRDGPATTRFRRASRYRRIRLARSHASRLHRGRRHPSGPSEPTDNVRRQRIDASARSRTRVALADPVLVPIRRLLTMGFVVSRSCDQGGLLDV